MTFECIRGSAELTDKDRHIIDAFRALLTETPRGVMNDFGHARRYFDTPEAFNAWRTRWLPYLAGLADGPSSRDEYTAHLPALCRWWEEWSAAKRGADAARSARSAR